MRARLAWVLPASSGLFLVAAVPLAASAGGSLGWIVLVGVVQVAFAGMGALLSSQLPRNPIGWLFSSFGLMASIAILLDHAGDDQRGHAPR